MLIAFLLYISVVDIYFNVNEYISNSDCFKETDEYTENYVVATKYCQFNI